MTSSKYLASLDYLVVELNYFGNQYCDCDLICGHENNPRQTWQHGVPTWCFLWRLLRCVGLEAALLDRTVLSLCVSPCKQQNEVKCSPQQFGQSENFEAVLSKHCFVCLRDLTCQVLVNSWCYYRAVFL